MAASLLGLGLLLGGARAQDYQGTTPSPYGLRPVATGSSNPSANQPTNAAGPSSASGVTVWRPSEPSGTQGRTTATTARPFTAPQTLVFEKPPSLPSPIQPIGNQPNRPRPGTVAQPGTDEAPGYLISVEPPGSGRIFGHLDSEPNLQERIRQERWGQRDPVEFPKEPVLSRDTYAGRRWPQLHETVEPNYVCYGRLYFEDKNSERYGWDLGIAQPLVSTGIFVSDLLLLPYHWGTDPLRCHECDAGYCLPGDPVPYIIYPPGLSASGAVAEGAAIAALIAIFP